jgi:hypothetical protein
MHRIILTEPELLGLENHGLAIGTPSQLSDVFRQGMAWADSRHNRLKLENQTMQNKFNQVIDYAIAQGYEAEDFLAAWSVWVTQASGQTLPLSK